MQALELLTDALSLWRGPLAAGIPAPAREHPAFDAVDRERLAAVRQAADAATPGAPGGPGAPGSPEGPEVAGVGARPPVLGRILDYVELHLTDPDLSPEVIARAHHISVRYLHKLFKGEGTTVGRWIPRRRLEECRRDLDAVRPGGPDHRGRGRALRFPECHAFQPGLPVRLRNVPPRMAGHRGTRRADRTALNTRGKGAAFMGDRTARSLAVSRNTAGGRRVRDAAAGKSHRVNGLRVSGDAREMHWKCSGNAQSRETRVLCAVSTVSVHRWTNSARVADLA